MNEVKLGNIVTHDQSSLEKLFSKIATVPIHDYDKADIEVNVERVAKQLRARVINELLHYTHSNTLIVAIDIKDGPCVSEVTLLR